MNRSEELNLASEWRKFAHAVEAEATEAETRHRHSERLEGTRAAYLTLMGLARAAHAVADLHMAEAEKPRLHEDAGG